MDIIDSALDHWDNCNMNVASFEIDGDDIIIYGNDGILMCKNKYCIIAKVQNRMWKWNDCDLVKKLHNYGEDIKNDEHDMLKYCLKGDNFKIDYDVNVDILGAIISYISKCRILFGMNRIGKQYVMFECCDGINVICVCDVK